MLSSSRLTVIERSEGGHQTGNAAASRHVSGPHAARVVRLHRGKAGQPKSAAEKVFIAFPKLREVQSKP